MRNAFGRQGYFRRLGLFPVCTTTLRAICSGADELSSDSLRLAPAQGLTPPWTTIGGAPYPFVHLFESEAVADTRAGPQTPFIPAMFTEEEDEEIPLPPRVMWLRAKSIDPTRLSFKRMV